MASREIRDLSPEMQVLYNKFYDRVRRDVELAKRGLTILPICTYRSVEEQAKLLGAGKTSVKPGKSKHNMTTPRGQPAAEAVDVIMLEYGQPMTVGAHGAELADHAKAVGLVMTISERGAYHLQKE